MFLNSYAILKHNVNFFAAMLTTQLSEKTALNRVTVTKLMKQLQKEGKIIINEGDKSIQLGIFIKE